MRFSRVALVAVSFLATAACYPIWLGNELSDRVDAVDNATRDNRAKQDETRRKLSARLDALDDSVDKLARTSTRSTANVVASTDDLVHQIQLLRGQLAQVTFRFEDVSKRFDALERRIAALGGEEALQKLEAQKTLQSVERPKSKRAFFALAKSYYDRKDYAAARTLFQEFIENQHWKFDDLAPKAQLLIGDSYYAEKDYRSAVLAYQKVRETWPTSRFLPDALYKLGLSFLQLGLRPEATSFLQEAAKYDGQQAGKDAKAKLAELSKK